MAKKNRANGEGTLEKRGKYYLARWCFHGKHYSKSTKCTDRREAEKVLAELVKPFQTGNEVDALAFVKAKLEAKTKDDYAKDEPTKIENIYTKYREDLSLNPITDTTETLYIQKLSKLENYCREKGIDFAYQFKEKNAKELLLRIKNRVSIGTYNQYGIIFKSVFASLLKLDNNIEKNPFHDFKKLHIDKSATRREFSDEEINRIHEALEECDIEIQILFYMAEYAGMRCSDIACCVWSNIDFKSNVIKYLPIKTKKNGKYAIVPIHPKLYQLLTKQLEKIKDCEDKEHVIPNVFMRFIKRNLCYDIGKVFDKAKINTSHRNEKNALSIETGFHALRHTFATKCSRDGIPIAQVQTMLGHSTPTMSLEYTHTNIRDLYLPEFNTELVQVKMKKSTYEKIIDLKRDNESFEDCIDRILNHKSVNLEQIWFDNEERKRKEAEETEKLIDEVFGKDYDWDKCNQQYKFHQMILEVPRIDFLHWIIKHITKRLESILGHPR